MFQNKMQILVAEDEPKIARAVADFLTAGGYHALITYDGEEALEQFYQHSPTIDLILLDVMMPKQDGFSVLRELRESSLVPVIMLTARGEEYDQLEGFRKGADDYIPKPFSPSLLMARIEAVLRRVGKSKNTNMTAGKISINTISRMAFQQETALELTPREFDLLYYLVLNKNLVLSREQLLNNVWGYDFIGDTRTVDTHIKQLRSKLGEEGDQIKTIYKVGYRFESSVETANLHPH